MLNRLMAASLIALMTTSAAYADDRGGKGRGMDFATVDVNGDGEVTAAELQASADARFAQIDANGDGELSLDEMKANAAERHGDDVSERRIAKMERVFNAMDKDGSGALSADERPHGDFDADVAIARMDENGDGVLTEDEFGKKGRKGGHRNKDDK